MHLFFLSSNVLRKDGVRREVCYKDALGIYIVYLRFQALNFFPIQDRQRHLESGRKPSDKSMKFIPTMLLLLIFLLLRFLGCYNSTKLDFKLGIKSCVRHGRRPCETTD